MTVTTSTGRVVHNGNGTTTQFAVPFRFLENAHVAVFLRDAAGGQTQWMENTNYTLTGAGEAAGGTLTVVTVPTDYTPAAGEKLVIVRAVPITQETDYVENDPFPAETHEQALDKLTMINQEQTERLDRTFTIPEADSFAGSFVLPIDTVRANTFQAYDNLGGPIVAVGTSANLGPVSAFIDTLLPAAAAPAARVTLDAQEDVITTRGDLVVGDSAGNAARLALGAAGEVLGSDGTDPVWTNASALPLNYLSGIETANNGADPTNDLDFTAGVRRDDGDTANLTIAATTRAIDAVFAEGGPGFRDSTDNLAGAKTFHLYAIGGAGKTDDLFASTSLAPTLPTGFTYKRRVFSRKWTGAIWQLGTQRGDRYDHKATSVISFQMGGPPADGVVDTPAGIVAEAILRIGQGVSGNAGTWGMLVYAKDVNDETVTVQNSQIWFNSGASIPQEQTSGDFRVRTDTASTIRHAEQTNGVRTGYIRTVGWVDSRGRDG